MTLHPIVTSYMFPIVLAIVALSVLGLVLTVVHRAGENREEDPAVRAAHDRQRHRRHFRRDGS